jgi:hypothetical protein
LIRALLFALRAVMISAKRCASSRSLGSENISQSLGPACFAIELQLSHKVMNVKPNKRESDKCRAGLNKRKFEYHEVFKIRISAFLHVSLDSGFDTCW